MEPEPSVERSSFEAHERLLLDDEDRIAEIKMSSERKYLESEVNIEGNKSTWYLIALTAGLGG
jgi:hypothetical protein